ncbi:hypothetical protein JHK82_028490 [Glycine max]|nr:hypothetical protein JHK82_028490 [Glycine max]KAG5152268.1 hypothetical protein JHK84_028740 [Glycine max]
MGTKFPVNSPFAPRSLTAGAVFGTTTSRWRPPLSSPTGSAVTSRQLWRRWKACPAPSRQCTASHRSNKDKTQIA